MGRFSTTCHSFEAKSQEGSEISFAQDQGLFGRQSSCRRAESDVAWNRLDKQHGNWWRSRRSGCQYVWELSCHLCLASGVGSASTEEAWAQNCNETICHRCLLSHLQKIFPHEAEVVTSSAYGNYQLLDWTVQEIPSHGDGRGRSFGWLGQRARGGYAPDWAARGQSWLLVEAMWGAWNGYNFAKERWGCADDWKAIGGRAGALVSAWSSSTRARRSEQDLSQNGRYECLQHQQSHCRVGAEIAGKGEVLASPFWLGGCRAQCRQGRNMHWSFFLVTAGFLTLQVGWNGRETYSRSVWILLLINNMAMSWMTGCGGALSWHGKLRGCMQHPRVRLTHWHVGWKSMTARHRGHWGIWTFLGEEMTWLFRKSGSALLALFSCSKLYHWWCSHIVMAHHSHWNIPKGWRVVKDAGPFGIRPWFNNCCLRQMSGE